MILRRQQSGNHRKAPGGTSLKAVPKPHMFAAGAALAVIVGIGLLVAPAERVQAKRTAHSVALFDTQNTLSGDTNTGLNLKPKLSMEQPETLANSAQHALSGKTPSISSETIAPEATISETAASETTALEASILETLAAEPLWQKETVLPGDSLTTIFKRLSLSERDVYLVAQADKKLKTFARLKPLETIAVALDDQGALAQVKYARSRLESYLYQRDGSGFSVESRLARPDLLPTFVEGRIENSLFLDASAIGLPQKQIMELAHIFGWDIDFALDIRKGDTFSALYEEQYLNGEKIGSGDILAARFTNQGDTYTAVRFVDEDGVARYYTPAGRPMRKAFLRAPLDFTRISSNFNLRRKHPIHKSIRAHRGVDYAAPRGTPVYAAGKGRVTASGYSKANGNYVFVEHGGQYVTKYLHLDRRKVKKGASVKQRQVIGTVGSTGYATGPHLHYEFLVSGVHRNPRTVKLPKAEPIPSRLKQRFVDETTPLLAQLETYTEYRFAALQ